MKRQQSGASGGAYVPVNAADAQEPFLVEAFAVGIPQSEFVELCAPATLPGGYELTVEVDGDQLTVLVVSRIQL
jgi:hypothetical protein